MRVATVEAPISARGWLLEQWRERRREIVARIASSSLGPACGERALDLAFEYIALGRVSRARSEVEALLDQVSADEVVLFAVALHAALIEALKPELSLKPASLAIDVGTVLSSALQAFVSLLREIAERRAVETDRARAHDLELRLRQLEASHDAIVREERMKAMSELAAGVAHDLNNSLNAVLLRAALVRRGAPLERQLDGIEREVNDAASVVERLQGFVRANAPVDVPVALNEVVREAVAEVQERMAAASILVWLDVDEVAPVRGERGELRSAIVNLLVNAADAIMASGVEGRIEVRTRASGSSSIVEVVDDGTGVPPQIIGRIFEPFFTTRGPSHSGLGLSMVYGCAQRLGGSITVENRDTRGATVRMTLPAAREARGERVPTR